MVELTLPVPARCFKVLLAMVPPPPLPPEFDGEDNVHSTYANSSPTALTHAICWALKARASSVWPLPAGPAGGKDGKGNSGNRDGNAGGSNHELDCTQIRMVPPP